jgi:hypothetical protein
MAVRSKMEQIVQLRKTSTPTMKLYIKLTHRKLF